MIRFKRWRFEYLGYLMRDLRRMLRNPYLPAQTHNRVYAEVLRRQGRIGY